MSIRIVIAAILGALLALSAWRLFQALAGGASTETVQRGFIAVGVLLVAIVGTFAVRIRR